MSGTLYAQDKKGILVMAHGGSVTWENTILNAVAPIKNKYITEVAFGMADPSTLQEAINKLEYQGVTTIVVVPLFISSHSPILRQAEFLFGFRQELADEPIVMNHGGSSANDSHSEHNSSNKSYTGEEETVVSLDPIVSKSKIILTNCLDADSLVAVTLFNNVKKFSKNPEQETILLVAHGPNDDFDNEKWLVNLDSLTRQMMVLQKLEAGKEFKAIHFTTIRDDANKKVYNEAKQKARSIVETANTEGDCIVVPLVISTDGIEKGIQKRLEGLNYTWVDLALLPSDNITKFIEQAILKTAIN
ncbi:MAG: hypothetical protein HYR91_01575 [Flavobacteriia bacterium]|nr:hypothetical protein [Flavobacteriia bacterium]